VGEILKKYSVKSWMGSIWISGKLLKETEMSCLQFYFNRLAVVRFLLMKRSGRVQRGQQRSYWDVLQLTYPTPAEAHRYDQGTEGTHSSVPFTM
jgi:hypothetical protein